MILFCIIDDKPYLVKDGNKLFTCNVTKDEVVLGEQVGLVENGTSLYTKDVVLKTCRETNSIVKKSKRAKKED